MAATTVRPSFWRIDENEEHTIETQLAAQGRMGCASGMADALRRLELDVARYQDWIARFAADFLRRHPLRSSGHHSCRNLDGAGAPIAAARVGLPGSGFYRRPHVCGELRTAFLGRAARFIGAGSGVAGDDPDLRHGVRASAASRRTIAPAKTCRRATRARWGDDYLRTASRF